MFIRRRGFFIGDRWYIHVNGVSITVRVPVGQLTQVTGCLVSSGSSFTGATVFLGFCSYFGGDRDHVSRNWARVCILGGTVGSRFASEFVYTLPCTDGYAFIYSPHEFTKPNSFMTNKSVRTSNSRFNQVLNKERDQVRGHEADEIWRRTSIAIARTIAHHSRVELRLGAEKINGNEKTWTVKCQDYV